MQAWRGVVGLEIHAQIAAKSKLFSPAPAAFSLPANTCVSLFDAAVPGTMPTLNAKCVELAVKTALALNCKVNQVSAFDRKHYFYADMPAGYQITQNFRPIATGGRMQFYWQPPDANLQSIAKSEAEILQLQLEQDSGKSLHDAARQLSLIDLNRAGIALMEIVTAPCMSCGAEAAGFVHELCTLLRSIGSSTASMSEAALRVDANVSVLPVSAAAAAEATTFNWQQAKLGVRTEVKNLNSIASLHRAIDFEINRQGQLAAKGQAIVNETMAFVNGITVPMRDKEKVQDYRFLPEPNLPPLQLQQSLIDELLLQLPRQLPFELKEKLRAECKVGYSDLLAIADRPAADAAFLTDAVAAAAIDKSEFGFRAGRFFVHCFLGNCDRYGHSSCSTTGISAAQFGQLLSLLLANRISQKVAERLLHAMFQNSQLQPQDECEVQQLWLISDYQQVRHRFAQFYHSSDKNDKQAVKFLKYTRTNAKKAGVILNRFHELFLEFSQHTVDETVAWQVVRDWLSSEVKQEN